MATNQERNHAVAVGDFVAHTLGRVDALCDEWPSLPLEAVLTALDLMKNRILIARMASLVSEGTGTPIAEDDELGDELDDDAG